MRDLVSTHDRASLGSVTALRFSPEQLSARPRSLAAAARTWAEVRCELPGEARLSLSLRTARDDALVHWEVALDRSFVQRERYGMLRPPACGRLELVLSGLAPGRMYWFRVQGSAHDRGVIGTFRTRSHKACRGELRARALRAHDYVAITPA